MTTRKNRLRQLSDIELVERVVTGLIVGRQQLAACERVQRRAQHALEELRKRHRSEWVADCQCSSCFQGYDEHGF
jgi:hypothetical protein